MYVYICIYIYMYIYTPLTRGKSHSQDAHHCVFRQSPWESRNEVVSLSPAYHPIEFAGNRTITMQHLDQLSHIIKESN